MGANNESGSSPQRMDLKSILISILFVILCCIGITTLFPFSDSSEMSGASVAEKADIDGTDESGTPVPTNTPTPSITHSPIATPQVVKESTKPTNQVPTETPAIESTEKIASETYIPVDPIGYVKVTTNANLRAGPGMDNQVVGGAPVGDLLPVFARTEDGWFMVDYPEHKWIWSSLVELDFALAEIPFADDIPQVTPLSTRQVDLGTEESNAEIAPPAGVEIDGKWVRPNDGHSMVYVPAGSFSMGGAGVFEQPVHEVNLDGYWIDEAEITNAQFAVFVSDTSYKTSAEQSGESRVIYSEENWDYEDGADWRHPLGPGSSLDGKKDHPVVHVSWEDAESYCTWAGARLPTEAEWEYAARGPNALKFPWGNSFDTTKLNFCDVNCPDDYYRDETANDGYAFTSPVGTYPQGASWVGALDMAGNVSEWINDWFDEEYYAISPIHNPQGPNSGEVKVFRDGGWDMDYLYLESHLRSFAGEEDSRNVLGFRCAIDATATDSGLTANQVIEVPTEIPVKEEVRSLGVEREDFFDVFKRLGFKFEEINDIDGQPRMMGTSPDGLAFVELYGPANELIKATLVVGISQVNPFEVEVSSAFVREFLDITVPEWDKGIDWVIENEEFASRNSEVSTTYGDRLIRLSIVPDLGILTLVVEAAGENP